jgi:hypothetical protein
MNQKTPLQTKCRKSLFILLFPLFFILPVISCTSPDSNSKAVGSDSLSAGSTVWETWNLRFKKGSSEPIREISMYYFEKALMDSLQVFKKSLDRPFSVGFQRNHDPLVDTLNYQIKVGFSDFGTMDTSKISVFSKVSISAESVSIPLGPGLKFDKGPIASPSPERLSGFRLGIVLLPLDSIRIIKPAMLSFVDCVSSNMPCETSN